MDDKIPGTGSVRTLRRLRLRQAGVYEEYLEWVKGGGTYVGFQNMRADRASFNRFKIPDKLDDGIPGSKRVRAMRRARLRSAGHYDEYLEWHRGGRTYEAFIQMKRGTLEEDEGYEEGDSE